MFDNKSKKTGDAPELNTELADLMLSKVLDHCDAKPNSLPLTTLESYSSLKRERFILQKVILILILLALLLLPLAFDVPKLHVTKGKSSTTINQPAYELTVSSLVNVKRVVAQINGVNLPVYETGDNVYMLEPTTNGKVVITVTLANHQFETTSFTVGSVDMTAPTIVAHSNDTDYLYLTVADVGYGVDFKNITAVDMNGVTSHPVAYDETTGVVTFTYPTDSINIYIPDRAGNKLQTIITVGEK